MITGHEIAMSLRSAYLSMHRQTNSFLNNFDMTADQFVLMSILAEHDGITQQELSVKAFSDPNTVRAMLVLMEKKGFVSRDDHTIDKRAKVVKLTSKGIQTYSEISNKIEPLQGKLFYHFEDEQLLQLKEYLSRISETISK